MQLPGESTHGVPVKKEKKKQPNGPMKFFWGRGALGFWVTVILVQVALWMAQLHTNVDAQIFATFFLTLVGFVAWHHDKMALLAIGLLIIAGLFLSTHGMRGYLEHFAEVHRKEILVNLVYLLLGFALFTRYFTKSGLSVWIARIIMLPKNYELPQIKGGLAFLQPLRDGLQFLLWLFLVVVPPIGRLVLFVILLSIGLDNIAAALIGGVLLRMMYRDVRIEMIPFPCKTVLPAAANLGGAPSAIGDTTSTLLYIAGVSPLTLAHGFVGVIPAAIALIAWVSWEVKMAFHRDLGEEAVQEEIEETKSHPEKVAKATHWLLFGIVVAVSVLFYFYTGTVLVGFFLVGLTLGVYGLFRSHAEEDIKLREEGFEWPQLFPLFGIVGLVLGNIYFHQPGLGLWTLLLAGIVLGKMCAWIAKKDRVEFELITVLDAVPPTVFLVLLVASTKMLPLYHLQPYMEQHDPLHVTFAAGPVSAVLDNIPFVGAAIELAQQRAEKEGNVPHGTLAPIFDWALFAFSIGFGGSMFVIGSSAGVALAMMYHDMWDVKKWARSSFAIFIAFTIGFFSIVAFRFFVPVEVLN